MSDSPSCSTTIVANKEDLLVYPSELTGVLCSYCFGDIRRIFMEGGWIVLLCSCYARAFDPSDARHTTLSNELWRKFRKNWQGKNPLNQTYEDSLRRGDFDLPIVNPSLTPNYDCWCPSCKRDRKMGGKSVWLSDTGDHVATFGVCLPCMNRLDASHQEGKKITTRRCEANLLSRYPFLESRL